MACEVCGGLVVKRSGPHHPMPRFCSRSCINRGRRRPTLEQRFWARIDKRGDDECWPWDKPHSTGYGRMKWSDGQQHSAQRIAYLLTYGWLPPEVASVCHKCDNPRCCNPRHLWLGTTADNNRDRHEKGRSFRGMGHHSARLTDEQVRAIRATTGPLKTAAQFYGVSMTTISEIRRWKKRTAA